MRHTLSILLIVLATPSLAHIGHLGEVAGHGHWIALGGIAIAGVIAVLGARKGKKEDPEEAEAEPSDEDGEPA